MSEIDSRLTFSQISEEDGRNLRAAWVLIQPELPQILDAFYRHICQEPTLAGLLGGHMERLKALQASHWERLFSGRFDPAYLEAVKRVGLVHKKIDLEPRWYIGGYRFLQEGMVSSIFRKGRGGKRRLLSLVSSVSKAVFLDIDLVISAYYEAMAADKAAALAHVVDTFGRALEEVERGNLNHSLDAPVSTEFGKMKDDFENLRLRFREVLGVVHRGAAELLGHAGGTTQSVTDLSSRTIEQAASLEETAAQSHEISRLVQRTASNAFEASQLVTEARKGAESGGSVVERATSAMSDIQKVASEVNRILALIDDIAEQTNILSLNAAIEAARAGNFGRGFSVVATAVRTLAKKSRDAASQIEDLMKRVIETTKDGTVLVEASKAQFHDVVKKVAQVETLIREISDASIEQAQGVEQISLAVGELSEVTIQNSQMVQAGLVAAEDMERLAQHQIELLGFFQIE